MKSKTKARSPWHRCYMDCEKKWVHIDDEHYEVLVYRCGDEYYATYGIFHISCFLRSVHARRHPDEPTLHGRAGLRPGDEPDVRPGSAQQVGHGQEGRRQVAAPGSGRGAT